MSQIETNDLNQFVDGTAAVADDVNNNFSVIKAAHNDTDSRVTDLEESSINKNGTVQFENLQSYKPRTITGATNATPIVITSAGHNLITDDSFYITGINGNTAANGTWTITKINDDTFSLNDSAGNGTYTNGGTGYQLPKDKEDLTPKAYIDDKLSGSASQTFDVANATAITNALALGQLLFDKSANGSLKIPVKDIADNSVKTMIIQWYETATLSQNTTANYNHPSAFPTACIFAGAWHKNAAETGTIEGLVQTVGWTATYTRIFYNQIGTGTTGASTALVLAIGY